MTLTHLNAKGEANMVDVSRKDITARYAQAMAHLRMKHSTLEQIIHDGLPKGDVLGVARVAGIQAAKKCSELIPLCHSLSMDSIQILFTPHVDKGILELNAECKVLGRTGVEMEAMTAVSVAALTVYDMCKAVDRSMCIERIMLLEKRGGRSGDWKAEDAF